MKTEDGGIDDILSSLPSIPADQLPPQLSPFETQFAVAHNDSSSSAADGPGLSSPTGSALMSGGDNAGQGAHKRTVCDHCRRRRIRCDGLLPCQPCINASLACKRDHVPLKRGPKRGRGRVINELRERYSIDTNGNKHSRENSADLPSAGGATNADGPSEASACAGGVPPPSDISWQNVSSDPRNAAEPSGAFSTEQYRPTTRSYLYLMSRCIDLYYEHIYPIMPLPYMPEVRSMAMRPPGELSFSARNYLFALCALTCFHMSGQNITVDAPTPSWESAGRFFLDECISARQSYDFFDDPSLHAVISSFWLSTSFFEINQSRKSWLYLREALTLAQELMLHDESSYTNLEPAEKLCRQRTFWQLFVTERSFAILRSKPITLKRTPSLPTTRHPYEAPDIHSGFLQLISSYTPLDESFVNAWNEGSDPRVTVTTYLALQNLLATEPPYLGRASREMSSRAHTLSTASNTPEEQSPTTAGDGAAQSSPTSPVINAVDGAAVKEDMDIVEVGNVIHPHGKNNNDEPAPTDIQKADLLITQQWLRLIVWQSSFRQHLLSWTAPDESMRFAFPLTIASRTAAVIQSLPPRAIEVHGMGIFEKIFEIGTWSMNVLQACDMAGASGNSVAGGGANMGMDFAGASDVGVLGVGRLSYSVDPLEFFVRTLSASPNSRTQYAERLLMFANEQTGGMRMALSPSLSYPPSPELGPQGNANNQQKADTTASGGAATTSATATATVTTDMTMGGSIQSPAESTGFNGFDLSHANIA
ncbi:c6 zinc finger domain containing protein [Ophiostoma piceae UAMH 11346]|uniref:C6 zinc finger domain containing protein n=1 Tax=Ophiostoma piceae (strain UAMH 11346) TaxID=1262450 RepID=S3BP63_OPHP1|nr:c6 zinc finger domain containing protein [Ophiostoma piceae UAMH 11346]